MALDKFGIARRIAQELRDGMYINLGIGIPTLVANYIAPGMKVTLTLQPATFTMAEDGKNPSPVDVTVTEKITNLTEDPISHLVLRSLEPQRVDPGELMKGLYGADMLPDRSRAYSVADFLAARRAHDKD